MYSYFREIFGGGVFAAVSIMLSCALYQSFLGCTIVLMIFVLIQNCLKRTDTFIQLIRKGIYYFFIVIVGLILYLFSMRIFLFVYQVQENINYGAYNMSLIEKLIKMPERIIYVYKSFVSYFFSNRIVCYGYIQKELFSVFAISYLIWYLIAGILNKLYSNFSVWGFSIFLHLLLPLAAGGVCLISPDNNMAIRTSAPLFIIIPCMFVLSDYIHIDGKKLLQQFNAVIMIAFIWMSFLSINATYEDQRQVYNYFKTNAMVILDDLIEYNTENKPVCIIGSIYKKDYYGNLYVENMGQNKRKISDFSYYLANTISYSWEGVFDAGANSWATFFRRS